MQYLEFSQQSWRKLYLTCFSANMHPKSVFHQQTFLLVEDPLCLLNNCECWNGASATIFDGVEMIWIVILTQLVACGQTWTKIPKLTRRIRRKVPTLSRRPPSWGLCQATLLIIVFVAALFLHRQTHHYYYRSISGVYILPYQRPGCHPMIHSVLSHWSWCSL